MTGGTQSTLAPGGIDAIGILRLGSNLTLGDPTLVFDIQDNAADQLAIAGSLTTTDVVTVDINASGTLAGTYTLATYGASPGLVPGDFVASGLPAGYALEVDANQMLLAPAAVPEPTSCLLLLAAAVLIGHRCRRRVA